MIAELFQKTMAYHINISQKEIEKLKNESVLKSDLIFHNIHGKSETHVLMIETRPSANLPKVQDGDKELLSSENIRSWGSNSFSVFLPKEKTHRFFIYKEFMDEFLDSEIFSKNDGVSEINYDVGKRKAFFYLKTTP